MRPSTRAFGNAVAGIIVVVAIIVLVMHAIGTHHTGSKAATIPTPSHSSPSAPSSETTKKPSATASPTSHVLDSQLTAQVNDFLEAYYLIKPDDTEATRRSRLAPLVPAPFLANLDLNLASGTAADQARIENKLTIQAQVMSDQLIAEPIGGAQPTMTVTVPVILVTSNPDGTTVQSFEVATTSKWQYQTDKWVILSFS